MLATPPRGRLWRAASALTLTLLLAVPALATAAPRMRLSATSVDFGRVAQQQVFKREVTIQNTGDAPLELSGVYTSCSCTEVSTRDTSVPPGGAHSWSSPALPSISVSRASGQSARQT